MKPKTGALKREGKKKRGTKNKLKLATKKRKKVTSIRNKKRVHLQKEDS